MTPRPVPLSVVVDGIPEELRTERRWVIWNYAWREENGKPGKWTKPLYIATAPAQPADSTDPTTWRSFAEALTAYEDGKSDGIGFVLGDGWVGFDSDHQNAPEHVDLLNTYAEYSPSGDGGIHAICRGRKPGLKCRVGNYELYDHGRYLTVTGHHISGTPTTVEERTAEIATLYARLFPNGNGAAPAATAAPSSSTLTDEALFAKASAAPKNGAKFAKLWAGDISDYDSHSEADLALCNLLAFWTNRDPARMDAMFRRSGLYREEKWNRLGADTIAKAIANTPKGYTGTKHQIQTIRASEVAVEKIEWLWQARLALGAITLVEGGPERGKSTILVDLAARVSRGHSFPGDAETREPANVVMLIAEDDIAATVVPRLIAAGADLARVFFLTATRDEAGDVVPFHLSDDCEQLRIKCAEIGDVALVIVDPLVSYLGSRKGRVLNTYNDMEVRKALAPLKELAERTRAAVAAIRHYRKNTGTNAMEAGGGSVAFAALVRVIIAALPDPEDDSRYLLAVAKNNLVVKSKRPALAYEIVPADTNPDIGRIAWGAAVEMSANEIFAAQSEADKNSSGKVGEAKEFLEEQLASGEWVPTTEILKAADANGLSKRALQAGKTRPRSSLRSRASSGGGGCPPRRRRKCDHGGDLGDLVSLVVVGVVGTLGYLGHLGHLPWQGCQGSQPSQEIKGDQPGHLPVDAPKGGNPLNGWHEELDRRCTGTNREGERCKRAPIPGGSVCVLHGGRSDQAQAAAKMRLLAMVEPVLGVFESIVEGWHRAKCPTCGHPTGDPMPVIRVGQLVLDRAGFHPTLTVQQQTSEAETLFAQVMAETSKMSPAELEARAERLLESARYLRRRNEMDVPMGPDSIDGVGLLPAATDGVVIDNGVDLEDEPPPEDPIPDGIGTPEKRTDGEEPASD